MLRLRIEIGIVSPFLRVLSGVLYAEEVNSEFPSMESILLFKCKFKKEQSTLGYSSYEEDEGIPTKLFNCIKPICDQMIRSYYKGMILDNEDYVWVPMEGDDSWRNIMDLRKEITAYIKKEKL